MKPVVCSPWALLLFIFVNGKPIAWLVLVSRVRLDTAGERRRRVAQSEGLRRVPQMELSGV